MKYTLLKLFAIIILLTGSFSIICAQDMEIEWTPSWYGDVNISCFGGRNGSIVLDVVGHGIPPFSYAWSNGDTTKNIYNLAAGYYRVEITDSSGAGGHAEITLVEPEPFLTVGLTKHIYSNDRNVTCHFCSDGAIAVSIEQGIPPFTYLWEDGTTTLDRTGISAGDYSIIVTDANGCTVKEGVSMSAPDRDDWMMGGNAGVNPATSFIGTTDTNALIMKTNNQERIKLLSNGNIKLTGMTGNGGMLYVDDSGIIHNGFTAAPCTGAQPMMWNNTATSLFTCPPAQVGIGTYSIPTGVRLAINGSSYFDGNVGIGINPDATYKLVVDGKIGVREVRVRATGAWPDYVFEENYDLTTFTELSTYFKKHKHLPGIPSAKEIEEENGFDVGKMQQLQLQKMEELYLYILQLEERIKDLEKK
ncbi:MAG: SprB repeat-containing protein [Bacteroidota bacterium]